MHSAAAGFVRVGKDRVETRMSLRHVVCWEQVTRSSTHSREAVVQGVGTRRRILGTTSQAPVPGWDAELAAAGREGALSFLGPLLSLPLCPRWRIHVLLLVTFHLQLGKEIASPDADRDQAGDANGWSGPGPVFLGGPHSACQMHWHSRPLQPDTCFLGAHGSSCISLASVIVFWERTSVSSEAQICLWSLAALT